MELWDAYDRELNKLGGVTLVRGEEVPDGMYHLVSGVIVKHTDGEFLLMQRAPTKHFGGMWEATAGGSALCGESPLDCARRELLEETGLSGEFTRIGTVVHDGHRSIYAEFLCVTDHDKNSVRLQTGETAASKWVGFEKLKSMEAELASVRCLHSYYEYGESNGNNQI